MSFKNSLISRFQGTMLNKVCDNIEAECKKSGFKMSVRGPDAPPNLDTDARRVNVHVDDKSIIKKITVG